MKPGFPAPATAPTPVRGTAPPGVCAASLPQDGDRAGAIGRGPRSVGAKPAWAADFRTQVDAEWGETRWVRGVRGGAE